MHQLVLHVCHIEHIILKDLSEDAFNLNQYNFLTLTLFFAQQFFSSENKKKHVNINFKSN